VGGFLGLLGMAVALWRSGAIPRAAVLLIPVFVRVDFLLQQGLVVHAIQFVTATQIAWVVLRGRVANRSQACRVADRSHADRSAGTVTLNEAINAAARGRQRHP
jgi:hypothetical protein